MDRLSSTALWIIMPESARKKTKAHDKKIIVVLYWEKFLYLTNMPMPLYIIEERIAPATDFIIHPDYKYEEKSCKVLFVYVSI